MVDNWPGKLLASAVMEGDLYSIRMRAERAGRHCCGAERIVPAGAAAAAVAELVSRALAAGAPPEAVHCAAELLTGELHCGMLPAVTTFTVRDWQDGRRCARTLLLRAGVAPPAVDAAMTQLAAGPAPGGMTMRGAMIIDAGTGARLEADPARGVRVSRMDLRPESRAATLNRLAAAGLGHHRVAEALVLAGKVLRAPGIVAELCWSDDPHYLTGYVADPRHGYRRISLLKATGDPHGGRALFISPQNWSREAFVDFLERQAWLFDSPEAIRPPQPWSG